jgi:chromosome segregation ATPase
MSNASGDLKLIQDNIKEVKNLIIKLNERLSAAKKSLSEAKIEVASCQESMTSKQSEVSREISSIKETLLKREDELSEVKRQLENTERSSREELSSLGAQLSEKSSQIASYENEIKQISGLSNELIGQLSELLAADSANTENVAAVLKQGGRRNQKKRSVKNLRRN